MHMETVFAQFRVRKLSFSHRATPNGLFNNSAACCGVFNDTLMITSFSHIWQQTSLQLSGGLMIQRQKKSSPRMEPCGLPKLEFQKGDTELLI